MTFLAINWLSLSITTLLFIFVIVCILTAIVVLMQRPKQEGLGAAFGGGVTDQVFGARTTDVLQKATWYLGSLFFLLCFSLAILIGKQNKQKPLLDPEKPVAKAVDSKPDPVAVPPTPPASLVNELPPVAPETTTPAETPAPPTPPAPPATQPE
jgi:preprotein translocase subunit SecG